MKEERGSCKDRFPNGTSPMTPNVPMKTGSQMGTPPTTPLHMDQCPPQAFGSGMCFFGLRMSLGEGGGEGATTPPPPPPTPPPRLRRTWISVPMGL